MSHNPFSLFLMFDQRMLPDLTLTSGLYVYHRDLRVSRTKNTVTFSLIITQQYVDYTVTRDINLPYQYYFVYFLLLQMAGFVASNLRT